MKQTEGSDISGTSVWLWGVYRAFNSCTYGSLPRSLPPFFTVWCGQSDTDSVLIDLKPQAAFAVIFVQSAKVSIGGGVGGETLFEFRIVGVDFGDINGFLQLIKEPGRSSWMYLKENPKSAIEWFYKFSQNTDYIRRYRILKDMRWKTATDYGNLDITMIRSYLQNKYRPQFMQTGGDSDDQQK